MDGWMNGWMDEWMDGWDCLNNAINTMHNLEDFCIVEFFIIDVFS